MTSKNSFAQFIGSNPRGLAIITNDGKQELIICDAWNHRIQRLDIDGNFISTFGSIGNGNENFNEPTAVIQGDNDSIWVLDRCNHRVKKHSLDGKFLTGFGKHLTENREESINYNFPQAFAKLDNATFVIADTGNNRLVNTTDSGVVLNIIKENNEKPPLGYPDRVIAINKHDVITAELNSPFKILNINEPWRKFDLSLNGNYNNYSAMTVIKQDNYDAELCVVHANRKAIERYQLLPLSESSTYIQQMDISKWNEQSPPTNMPAEQDYKYVH